MGVLRAIDRERPRAKLIDKATRAAVAMLARRGDASEPLAAYAAGVLDRRARERLRDVEGDRGRLRMHVERDPIGALAVGDVISRDVRAWLARMLVKSATKGSRLTEKPLALQTVQNALNLLRVVFQSAVHEGRIERSPCDGVRIAGALKRARPARAWTVLSADELARVIHWASSDLAERVIIASRTGVRLSELHHLRWDDVHLLGDAQHAAAFVLVRRGNKGGPTKGGKVRRVPLLPEALAVLVARRARCMASDLVFPSPRAEKRARSKTGYRRAWARALRLAHVTPRDGLGFHVLRHTCATGLLAGWWGPAWPITAVAKMLGHSSVTVTERYAKALDGTLFDLCKLHASTENRVAENAAVVSEIPNEAKSESTRAHTQGADNRERQRDARETQQTAEPGRISDRMDSAARNSTSVDLTADELATIDAGLEQIEGASRYTARHGATEEIRLLRSRLRDLNSRPTVYETGAAAAEGGKTQERAGSEESNGLRRCRCGHSAIHHVPCCMGVDPVTRLACVCRAFDPPMTAAPSAAPSHGAHPPTFERPPTLASFGVSSQSCGECNGSREILARNKGRWEVRACPECAGAPDARNASPSTACAACGHARSAHVWSSAQPLAPCTRADCGCACRAFEAPR